MKLIVFFVVAATAANLYTAPAPRPSFDLAASVSQNLSSKRDTQYCCTYHTSSCCSSYSTPQCCEGENSDFCCSLSSYCCASTSYYYYNSKCCTYDRCCQSSGGYDVTCCDYDEVCCSGECKSSCGISTAAIIGIVIAAGIILIILVAVCIAVANSNARRRRMQQSSQPAVVIAATTTPAYAAGAGPGATIQSGPYPGAAAPTAYASGPYPGAPAPTAYASGPYPGAAAPGPYPGAAAGPYPGATMPQSSPQSAEIDPRLSSALQTVRQGIVVALVGIANDRMSVDDGITLMALAASEALGKCQCSSQAEFDRAASLIFQYMNQLFTEIVPSMGKEQREALITTVLQRMTSLAQQQKRARLEESLEAIKQSFVTVWAGVVANKISLEDAQQLMGVAVAAALRNCSITSSQQLTAHVQAFTQWMMIVANECAPTVPPEVKQQVIQAIWANAATHF